MTRCVAFVRGINVGGSNKLPMADLRATVESLGHTDVSTYVNSGNVLFESADGSDADVDEDSVAQGISTAIAARNGLTVGVVVRTVADLCIVAGRHPDAAGEVEAKFLHVLFLSRLPDPSLFDAIDPTRFAPDRWTVDGREVYICYPNGVGRSKLTLDVFERALDVIATGRNLNTVRKLVILGHPD